MKHFLILNFVIFALSGYELYNAYGVYSHNRILKISLLVANQEFKRNSIEFNNLKKTPHYKKITNMGGQEDSILKIMNNYSKVSGVKISVKISDDRSENLISALDSLHLDINTKLFDNDGFWQQGLLNFDKIQKILNIKAPTILKSVSVRGGTLSAELEMFDRYKKENLK